MLVFTLFFGRLARMPSDGLPYALFAYLAAGLPNVKWIEYFMADNPLLEFQSRLFKGPVLREERTEDGILLIPPDGPGLGLELDEAVAAASLVPE